MQLGLAAPAPWYVGVGVGVPWWKVENKLINHYTIHT
jgi:hypothetical protein